MTLHKNIVTIAAALTGSIVYTPSAFASETQQAQSIVVPTSDLDLADQEDRDELDFRIIRAARRICGRHHHAWALDELRCVSITVRTARPQRNAAIARAHSAIPAPDASSNDLQPETSGQAKRAGSRHA